MENKQGSILIVDDNEELLIALKLFLNPHFSKIRTEKNPNIIPSIVSENYDVIILDMNFSAGINSGNEGIFWMKEILSKDPSATIVFITGYSDVELAVKAIKEGAADFIQKSWDEKKILSTIIAAYKLRQSKIEISQLKSKQKHLNENIGSEYPLVKGNSPMMEKLYDTINKVSMTMANVFLFGENGTGKEIIAREIHRQSDRKDEIFVSVDLGAVSESLFESELFGHTKGSFTDAKEDREGRFELASGGTLFLDEIGNLPLQLQAKLLSSIQNQEIVRVGSNQSIPVDIRLICATNKDIYQMVENNEFREDLLYRINTIQLEIPPLRDRTDDIPAFVNHFFQIYTNKYRKKGMSISKTALEKLKKHYWHGNVRELQHTIEKAVILADNQKLKVADFFLQSKTLKSTEEEDNFNLATNERLLIKKAIEQFKGNLSLTSKMLGINRSTLYDKMKKYDL